MPPLSAPGAETISGEAIAHYGITLSAERARKLAEEVGRMLAAVDRAAPALAFEDEPAGFQRAQRAATR
jgi:hypothetical protein